MGAHGDRLSALTGSCHVLADLLRSIAQLPARFSVSTEVAPLDGALDGQSTRRKLDRLGHSLLSPHDARNAEKNSSMSCQDDRQLGSCSEPVSTRHRPISEVRSVTRLGGLFGGDPQRFRTAFCQVHFVAILSQQLYEHLASLFSQVDNEDPAVDW